jgi:hypothetical protein
MSLDFKEILLFQCGAFQEGFLPHQYAATAPLKPYARYTTTMLGAVFFSNGLCAHQCYC